MIYIINNSIIKKILISLLLVVMISNFILPNRVQALSGGDLAQPIFQFITWLGDIVLEFMQKPLVGVGTIQDVDDQYAIKYSPGIIFSGEVLAFDINFLNPKESKEVFKEKVERLYHIETTTNLTAEDIKEKFKEWVLNNLSTETIDNEETESGEKTENNENTENGGGTETKEEYDKRKKEYIDEVKKAIQDIKNKRNGESKGEYSVISDFEFEEIKYRIRHNEGMGASGTDFQLIKLEGDKEKKILVEHAGGELDYLAILLENGEVSSIIKRKKTSESTAESNGEKSQETTTEENEEKTEDEKALEIYLNDADFWYYTSGDEYVLEISGVKYLALSGEVGSQKVIEIYAFNPTAEKVVLASTAKVLQSTIR